jgi:hypothetical protein
MLKKLVMGRKVRVMLFSFRDRDNLRWSHITQKRKHIDVSYIWAYIKKAIQERIQIKLIIIITTQWEQDLPRMISDWVEDILNTHKMSRSKWVWYSKQWRKYCRVITSHALILYPAIFDNMIKSTMHSREPTASNMACTNTLLIAKSYIWNSCLHLLTKPRYRSIS